MSSHAPYPNPPITEAIIELRLREIVPEADLEKVSPKLKSLYPNETVQQGKDVKVDLDQSTASFESKRTWRRTNLDEDEVVIVNPNALIVAQLPVYQGWDHFFGRFLAAHKVWKKVLGFRQIARVGMRFVNRIDVPMIRGLARHEDYLDLEIKLPAKYPHNIAYNLTVQLALEEIKCVATVRSGTVPSPLPSHAGILLDIDIGTALEVPQRDAEVIELLNKMRDAKNDLFETFIHDKARETFYGERPIQ